MPRMQSSTLQYPTQRLKLKPGRMAHPGPNLAHGIQLQYRRNAKGAGSWIVRVANSLMGGSPNPKSPYWTRAFALADDYDKADGVNKLNYGQAQDRAKELARGGDADAGKPATVAQALDAYEQDLIGRGANPANARRVRYYMTPALAAKPVAMLTVKDLRDWRDGLKGRKGKLSPAGVNRTKVGLRAALEFAAASDRRIGNRDVFRLGLKGLPNANKARRIVLPDAEVLRIVSEAYAVDQPFGLLVEVLAQTGARTSQVVRLNCSDLRPGERLMVPTSYKGGVKKRECVSVPITAALTAALEALRTGRADDEPLLRNPAGVRWHSTAKLEERWPFRGAVKRAGLDPDVITPYALRHSSICRSLLAGVPETIVAQLHDTSVKEIEAHYAKHISRLGDDVARRGLLQAPADNVVDIQGRAA
jgi:integrase